MPIENYVDPQEILQIVKNGLLEVMDEDYDYYKDYKVYLSLEKEFIKEKQKDPKAIYVVLKMGNTSINFGQTVLPIDLVVMSEQNKSDICQRLFISFVNKYNLQMNDDATIRQVYESPVITSNFEKVYEGFRSILSVSGFFVISKNANFYKLYYKVGENFEEIPFLTFRFNANIQLDSQPFYNKKNFTESVSKYGVITINFTSYLLSDIELMNDALSVAFKNKSINSDFNLKIVLKSGEELIDNFKIVSVDSNQEIGSIPVVSFSFTN